MVKLVHAITKVQIEIPEELAGKLGSGWEPLNKPKRASVKK